MDFLFLSLLLENVVSNWHHLHVQSKRINLSMEVNIQEEKGKPKNPKCRIRVGIKCRKIVTSFNWNLRQTRKTCEAIFDLTLTRCCS